VASEVAAVERLARAAQSAEGLCGVLWEALHDELSSVSPAPARASRVAELAERLAQVSSAVAEVARGLEAGGSSAVGREPADVAPDPFPEPPVSAREIAIHDARGEGPAAWVQAIGSGLDRYASDALPFAVLLVEVLDVERLPQARDASETGPLLGRLEGALRGELRPGDAITLESRGRWWLTVARADAPGARALGERLARVARSAATDRGVPLEVAIGIATCPEDGHDAATLAAHADVGLYAARAAGQSLPPR
jgi:hypothetical protein